MKKTVALFLMAAILCCSFCGCAKPFSKVKGFLKPQDKFHDENSSFSNESDDNEEKISLSWTNIPQKFRWEKRFKLMLQ